MPGPMPDPNAQRRNAATIPTTELPVDGRTEPAPDVPDWRPLGRAGTAYWLWAWSTSEAAAWGTGAVDAVARRASLEDDLAAVELSSTTNVHEILDVERGEQDMVDMLEYAFKALGRLAGSKLAIVREMGKLDTELGLTPKAAASLRWRVVGAAKPVAAADSDANRQRAGSGSRGRLHSVG